MRICRLGLNEFLKRVTSICERSEAVQNVRNKDFSRLLKILNHLVRFKELDCFANQELACFASLAASDCYPIAAQLDIPDGSQMLISNYWYLFRLSLIIPIA